MGRPSSATSPLPSALEEVSISLVVPFVHSPSGFIEYLRSLEPELLGHLRTRFPDIPGESMLRYRPLRVEGSHQMVVVESRGEPSRRLLVKGPRRVHASQRKMETEYRVLTTVAPVISARNARTRCPEVVAYYPERGLLLLEMIDGVTLKSLLFGRARIPESTSAQELLRLCGEWLAGFHGLTRLATEGNPFEWALGTFTRRSTQRIFEKYADVDIWTGLCHAALQLARAHVNFRRPLCLLKQTFTPNDVLVEEGRIYVVDFEVCYTGYAYEDLAGFTAFGHLLLPWRRGVAAARRTDLGTQERVLLSSYYAHAPASCREDHIMMTLARVVVIARSLLLFERRSTRWQQVKFRMLEPYWRRRFRAVCRETLGTLREAE